MQSYYQIIALLLVAQNVVAQISPQKVAQVNVSDIENLTTVVQHTMGNVNVKGYSGNAIFAYSEETLPSLNTLKQSTSDEIFHQLTTADFQEREIQLRKIPEFTIDRKENVVDIKTNVYSFNTNVYVVAPYRSNIAVNVKDMGDISIADFDGHVEANTASGSIYIKDVDGLINANTKNGNVVSEFKNDRVNPLFVSTFVGNIEVIVPKTVKGSVLASSEMGSLYSNFSTTNGLSDTATNQHVKNRKINFSINGGGTEFVIYTFKGDIYLRYLE